MRSRAAALIQSHPLRLPVAHWRRSQVLGLVGDGRLEGIQQFGQIRASALTLVQAGSDDGGRPGPDQQTTAG
jgi:hypothetical protein